MAVSTQTPETVSIVVQGNTTTVSASGQGNAFLTADPSSINTVDRAGNDLVIGLLNGEVVRIEGYFLNEEEIALFFQDEDGGALVLSDVRGGGDNPLLLNLVEATETSGGSGGGGGALGILGALGGVGAAALAAGGGSDSDGSADVGDGSQDDGADQDDGDGRDDDNGADPDGGGGGDDGSQDEGAGQGDDPDDDNGADPDEEGDGDDDDQDGGAGGNGADPPEAPTLVPGNGNVDGTLGVAGTAEPGATVTVTFPNGEVVTVDVQDDGTYAAVSSTVQPNGTVSASQTDADGLESEDTTAQAVDTTVPLAPTVVPGAGNEDGTLDVTGTGEPGATVTVTFPSGEAVQVLVDGDGTYAATSTTVQFDGVVTATQTDLNGQGPSPTGQALFDDTTVPLAPTVVPGAGNEDGTLDVTGTGEPGATVTVTFPSGEAVAVRVANNGNYAVSSTVPQPEGEVTAIQTDRNGEGPSDSGTAIYVDATGPTVTIEDISANVGGFVTIEGVVSEPGANVTVTFPDTTTQNVVSDATSGAYVATSVNGNQPDAGTNDIQAVGTDLNGVTGAPAFADYGGPDIQAFDDNVSLTLDVTPTVTNQVGGPNGSVGSLVSLGVLGDTINVDLLASSTAFSVNVAENTTQQLTVSGQGDELLGVNLVTDNDLDLAIYRQEAGSDQAMLVATEQDWLEYSSGLLGALGSWDGEDLQLDPFIGGATYHVVVGNNGGLLDLGVLTRIEVETVSNIESDFDNPMTVDGTVSGNVIIGGDVGEGADRGATGTFVSDVDGTTVATGGTQITGDHGILTINPDGSYVYVADSEFTGEYGVTDSFSYTATAPGGATSMADLNISLDFALESVDPIEATAGQQSYDFSIGVDVLSYDFLDVDVDTVTDFNLAEGDAIDLSALISGATPATLGSFVEVEVLGDDTLISVDTAGSGTFVPVVELTGVSHSLEDLEDGLLGTAFV